MGKEAERAKQPHLEITGTSKHEGIIRVQVINTGGSVARGCYGKITIEHTREDVLNPSYFGVSYSVLAFITPDSYTQVENAALCWAKSPNLPEVNIPVGGVPDLLQVACLQQVQYNESSPPDYHERAVFNIPSEEGWGENSYLGITTKGRQFPSRRSRVVLTAKTYDATLFVGSENTQPVAKKIVLVYDSQKKQAYLQLGVDVSTRTLSD